MKKLDTYQEKIDKASLSIKEQNLRINCFQGLINQLREVLRLRDEQDEKE